MGTVTVTLERGGLRGSEAGHKASTEEEVSIDQERSRKVKNLAGLHRVTAHLVQVIGQVTR